MEPKKLSFLIKAVYDVLPPPVNLHAWGLTTSDRCRACGKTVSTMSWRFFLKFQKHVVRVPIKLWIFSTREQFSSLKKEIFRKLTRENMRKASLLEGCTDWHVATDLKHNFIFPTKIALTTKRPDIVILSVKAKKSFRCWVNGPFWRKFRLGTSAYVGKVWRSARTMCQKWLDNKCISYRSRMQRFYCQLNLRFLD